MARVAILVCLACVVPAHGDARPSIAKIGALVDTLDAQLQQLQQLEKRKEKREFLPIILAPIAVNLMTKYFGEGVAKGCKQILESKLEGNQKFKGMLYGSTTVDVNECKSVCEDMKKDTDQTDEEDVPATEQSLEKGLFSKKTPEEKAAAKLEKALKKKYSAGKCGKFNMKKLIPS